MTQQYTPNLGQIPDESAKRDAVHIAVAPVTALHYLDPGERVRLTKDGKAESSPRSQEAIGIVDPYLHGPVLEGQRFWLFLFPNSVTSLRHVWTHPAFSVQLESQVEQKGEAK